jgi:LDH2 family malate/lactate/ureidoglycolate dehydrogenase
MTHDVTIQPPRLRSFCGNLLERTGVPTAEARILAEILVEADLEGIDSHGVARMPDYLNRLRHGGIRRVMRVEAVVDRAAIAVFDACQSIGHVAAQHIMNIAIKKAKVAGISFVTVRNSNHYGVAGYFAKMALANDMIGFTGTNAAARIPPYGGRTPLFGTNPFAVAIPAGKRLPVVADMASSVVARGKIILAAKKNQPIPCGWAINSEGEDTTDARSALEGAVLPFGGPKGSAIAMIIETLTSMLAGAMPSIDIPDMRSDPSGPGHISHYFGAIDIAAFGPVDLFKAQVDRMIKQVKEGPRAKGVEEIYVPGEIQSNCRQKRLEKGIPIADVTVQALEREGALCGVSGSLL